MLKKLFSKEWLQTKLIVTAVVASVFHNLFYAVFGFEEAVLFLIGVFAFLAFLIYTIVFSILIIIKGDFKKLLKLEQFLSILVASFILYVIISQL